MFFAIACGIAPARSTGPGQDVRGRGRTAVPGHQGLRRNDSGRIGNQWDALDRRAAIYIAEAPAARCVAVNIAGLLSTAKLRSPLVANEKSPPSGWFRSEPCA